MANKTINELPGLGLGEEIVNSDRFAIQEAGGTTKNVQAKDIATYVANGIGVFDLEQVLTEGNSTGENDIEVYNGFKLKYLPGITGWINSIGIDNNMLLLSMRTPDSGSSLIEIQRQRIRSNSDLYLKEVTAGNITIVNILTNGFNTTTSNATPLAIAFSVPLANTVLNYSVKIIGHNSDYSKVISTELQFTLKQVGSGFTRTFVGVVDKTEKSEFSTATVDAIIESNDIKIRLTGEASTSIKWSMLFDVEIFGNI